MKNNSNEVKDEQEFVPEVGQVVLGTWKDYTDVEVEVSAYKGDKVWVTCCGLDEVINLSNIKFQPLKTEAELKREAEIQKIDRAYSCALGYAVVSANNMSESLYKQGVRVVDEKFIEEAAKDKGYIKPRGITQDDIIKALKFVDNDYFTSGFTNGVRWAEKRIKRES